jgi:hypothetical protein
MLVEPLDRTELPEPMGFRHPHRPNAPYNGNFAKTTPSHLALFGLAKVAERKCGVDQWVEAINSVSAPTLAASRQWHPAD